MDTNTTTEDLAASPLPIDLFVNISNSISGCCAVLGIICNVFTIIVLRSKRLRESSTSTLLLTLAVFDTTYQLLIITRVISFFEKHDIRQHQVICQLQPFLTYTNSWSSVWILVLVTIDRSIHVFYPFKAKLVCSQRNALMSIAIISIIIMLICSNFFFTKVFDPVQKICIGKFDQGMAILDLFMIGVLPILIISVINIGIIVKLKKQARFRQKTSSFKQVSETNSIGDKPLAVKQENGKYEKGSNLTNIMVCSSVFFVITTFPLLIYDTHAVRNQEISSSKYIIEKLCYHLFELNFQLHFFIYCLSGPIFRNEAQRLIESFTHKIKH